MNALVEREPKGLLGRTHAEAPRQRMLRIPDAKVFEGLRASWPGEKKAPRSLPRARLSATTADNMTRLHASDGKGTGASVLSWVAGATVAVLAFLALAAYVIMSAGQTIVPHLIWSLLLL